MRRYDYLDIDRRAFGGIEVAFPGWKRGDERICVYSPHDDDAILGAGYLMRAALDAGAPVTIIIVCSGDCGYSTPAEKEGIVERRHRETVNVYGAFGIPEEDIVFLNYPDFSALSYLGRIVAPGREGHFRKTITELRKRKITRILVPNCYREHVDHIAAGMMAAYDAPQAGDMHSVDWAEPYEVRSTLEYSVWAEMDPEDALVACRDVRLRANTVVIASEEVEQAVGEGLREYVSQKEIISDLMAQRTERRTKDGRYIEVYRRFDPRPKLSFKPYKEILERLAE